MKRNWYWIRYDRLIDMGFSSEEASIIASVRLSSPPIRRLMLLRHRDVELLELSGVSHLEAIRIVRERALLNDKAIMSWTYFRNILYPKKEGGL